ncbi:MAG: bacillithiol system redox-active protein YtxJ [bacterium]
MADLTNLTTREQLDALFDASAHRSVVLLKHSLDCGSSKSTLRDLRTFAARLGDDAPLFALIEIQSARALSDEIAARTGVAHESPQVILLRDGRAAWHASHWRISTGRLADALASASRREG